jgi:hypothetical protein
MISFQRQAGKINVIEGTEHVRFVMTHSKIMTTSFDVNIPLGKLGARIF